MDEQPRFERWASRWRSLLDRREDPDWPDEALSAPRWGDSLWRHLLSRNVEIAEVEEEVAAEQQSQIVLASRDQVLNRYLLARLRQQPPIPPGGDYCYEGFFTLLRLPTEAETALSEEPTGIGVDWIGSRWTPEEWIIALREADLVLYVFRREADWQAEDAHWVARLRAARTPLIPVAVSEDLIAADEAGADEQRLRERIGMRPVSIHLGKPADDGDVLALVQRALALRPRLAIPMAQEIPCSREWIARRVIRGGAWMTALLGSEPIPMLDIPLQLAVQWRMALQLGAIYGRPGLDYRSREMMGTVALNLGTRYLAQQALKLIPIVGWLVSAAISGASTWLLGETLLRYFREERVVSVRWPLREFHLSQWLPQRFRERRL
ncbi:MAG: hypothetical protein Kow0047_31470 [Anaerolineae bacterium]